MYETSNSPNAARLDNYDMQAKTATAKLGLKAHSAELRGAIEETSKRLHALESRLNPVLIPTPLQTNSDPTSAPAPIRSPLLNASFDAKYAINGLMRHIESLLNRIEL